MARIAVGEGFLILIPMLSNPRPNQGTGLGILQTRAQNPRSLLFLQRGRVQRLLESAVDEIWSFKEGKRGQITEAAASLCKLECLIKIMLPKAGIARGCRRY